jgi:plasmid stabilization system protein ParE
MSGSKHTLAWIFLKEVQQGVGVIKSQPKAWTRVSESLRCYILRRFPYKILYQLTAEEIVVVAVIHAKRNPKIWRARE